MQKSPAGRVRSVNVGGPAELDCGERVVSSAIGKQPVDGPVAVGPLGLKGDSQVDRKNHGGETKAVYAYPQEHYDYWATQLGKVIGGPGQFGENLTVEGLLETALRPGDRLQVGELLLEVTKPRTPCYKLAAHLGVGTDFARRFLASGRTGFYLRVLRPGPVRAGDAVAVVASAAETGPSIADLAAAKVRRPGLRTWLSARLRW